MFRASKNEVADPLLSNGPSCSFFFFFPSFMSYHRYITIEQMTELLSFFYAVEPEVYEAYKVSLPSTIICLQ